jgi:hypothetical protein
MDECNLFDSLRFNMLLQISGMQSSSCSPYNAADANALQPQQYSYAVQCCCIQHEKKCLRGVGNAKCDNLDEG